MSAVAGEQVELLAGLLAALMPESPPLYPDGELTDEPELVLVAELIREAALEGVRDELPHSIAVVVEEMLPREDRPPDRPLLDVHAFLYVERDSQKGIVIGPQGTRLRDIGTRARAADRGPARHAGLPRPARHRRQGLAARPPPAAQARLLSRTAGLGGSEPPRPWAGGSRGVQQRAPGGERRQMCRVVSQEFGGTIAAVAEARGFVAASRSAAGRWSPSSRTPSC